MNAVILFIIGIPAIEIYLMIKVGGAIGAFNTIILIFFTAITGVYFAKIAGLSTLKSGFNQLIKNEIPVYEIISGAALAFAAFLLILPGFLTDIVGFLLIIPITRKLISHDHEGETGNVILLLLLFLKKKNTTQKNCIPDLNSQKMTC